MTAKHLSISLIVLGVAILLSPLLIKRKKFPVVKTFKGGMIQQHTIKTLEYKDREVAYYYQDGILITHIVRWK